MALGGKIMKVKELMEKITSEIRKMSTLIEETKAESLSSYILSSPTIFVTGMGRSGFVARAFAMRLMHLGFNTHFVGEVTTPKIKAKDLLIACSSSGETANVLEAARKSKKVSASICSITSRKDSSLSKLSDLTIIIPGPSKINWKAKVKTIQPLGSLFEQTLLIYLDSIIISLMKKKKSSAAEMLKRHTNLE